MEQINADNIDLISAQKFNINQVEIILEKRNLNLNGANMEMTKISKTDEKWKSTMKFHIKLRTKQDQRQKGNLTFSSRNKLSKVWRG